MLQNLDSIFQNFSDNGLSNPDDPFAAILFVRAHSAFRVASGLTLSTPIESYSVMRCSLEYAGYAMLCHTQPKLGEALLRRDDTLESLRTVRAAFNLRDICLAISSSNSSISECYRHLYESVITWGAHPNEKAITSGLNIIIDDDRKVKTLQIAMLPSDGPSQRLAARHCAEIGLCGLEIFGQIFRVKFDQLGLQTLIKQTRGNLSNYLSPL